MKCPNCGNNVANNSTFCEYCGTKIEQTPVQNEPVVETATEQVINNVTEEKQRHGFITFWLWFMAIVNPIAAIANFASGISIGVVAGILGIVNCVAAILLLFWRKAGFWLFLAMGSISCVMGIVNESFVQALGAVAGVAILFGILQLKKNDQSYWSQLR